MHFSSASMIRALIAFWCALLGVACSNSGSAYATENSATELGARSPSVTVSLPVAVSVQGLDKKKPKVTAAMKQALGAAKDYLAYDSFSRQGLIDQLSSPYGGQFKKADATWAVDQLKVNWNKQAYLAAKGYLAYSHFSRQGLIDQLSSKYGGKFTLAQAKYAANKVGL
ncbi:MAG: hypothetical protein EBS41_04580 [Actinobacteria bacterium]|nr:hypothetical protein [Actinomycetota bacterium]